MVNQLIFINSFVDLIINLIYVVISLFIGVFSIKAIDKMFLPQINLEEEIKKGNLAASIFTSSILIFVAVLIASTLN